MRQKVEQVLKEQRVYWSDHRVIPADFTPQSAHALESNHLLNTQAKGRTAERMGSVEEDPRNSEIFAG